MHLHPKRKLAIFASVLAAGSFAGGAYAATQDSSANPSQAFLTDVATRLNVSPQKLTAALDGAVADELNRAVAAGTLTIAQAHAIEQRVQRDGFLPFALTLTRTRLAFGQHAVGSRPFAATFAAAAKYLGVSVSKLRSELRSGESPAQIASAHHKSVTGLLKVMIDGPLTDFSSFS